MHSAAGFVCNSAIWTSGSIWKRSRVISAGGNGIASAREPSGVSRCFGNLPAHDPSPVARHGGGKSPMARNLKRLGAGRSRRHRLFAASSGGKDYISIDDDMPPKPKWMRWNTYERITRRCEANEAICNQYLLGFLARLENQH